MPLRARVTRPLAASAGRSRTMASAASQDEPDDVLFSTLYGVRTVELNRPKKLNSLNGSMARKIIPRLREWEKSDMANVILLSGAGEKALCAGGDVAALAEQNKQGKEGQRQSTDYFALEYQLDHLIATYSKPYIAIMDGITMGGGVGLSVHAPFRIATEKTIFAMPETTIGFFPDVGGGFFLSRLDGEIGTYLALTSERLLGSQAFYAGIATHYLDSSVLGQLTTRLSELRFADYASLQDRLQLINATIAEFSSGIPPPNSYPKSPYGDLSGALRTAIDRCFAHNSVEEILSALRNESESNPSSSITEWAAKTLTTISTRSPTSLRVTLRQLRVGANWDINEAFIAEHAIASKFMAHPDFVEGVSARLMSKPPRDPSWEPADLNAVSNDVVEGFFERAEGVPELALLPPAPGKGGKQAYTNYPHARFALPREGDVQRAVRERGQQGKEAVVAAVEREWGGKEGVREKVEDVLKRRGSEGNSGTVSWN